MMPNNFRVYPDLSERFVYEHKEHLDRMRFFLDDLLKPFTDGAVKIHDVPIKATYKFWQVTEEPMEHRPYSIKIYISRLGMCRAWEISMRDYDFINGTGRESDICNWEEYTMNVIRDNVQKLLWDFLEIYTNATKRGE